MEAKGSDQRSTLTIGIDGMRNADSVVAEEDEEQERDLLWSVIERLPSHKRGYFALFSHNIADDVSDGVDQKRVHETVVVVDVRKLGRSSRDLVVKNAFGMNEQDNYELLSAIKRRLDRVGLGVPKVEVRFENLTIKANVQIGTPALPTLLNFYRDSIEQVLTALKIFKPQRGSLTILDEVSGLVRPKRMTLLIGPPSSGKSTLLKALAGKLESNLKKNGNITYNGHTLDEFCVQTSSVYISQTDNHIAELTVRETLDYAARFQGSSDVFAGFMEDLARLEKEKKIRPSPEIDTFMKAYSVSGMKHSLSTDYILKVLGLDVCADTVVGNDMIRGVSGGQRKRVTIGEMIIGPTKTIFMDEISTGLDSSTTYQIVKCMRNFVHLMEGTVLIALLQPAPEIFDLFDDIMLLSEGHMVYQGPREYTVEFFDSLGFKLPPRKGIADFLQEVTAERNQAQYWADNSRPHEFLSVRKISDAFKSSNYAIHASSILSVPCNKSKSHLSSLSKDVFALSKWDLFKTCFAREALLMNRNRFVYVFRTCQVAFVAFVTCTMFLRTRFNHTNEANGNLDLGCLFFGMMHLTFDGFSELSMMIYRLPNFYKQRDDHFYPSWAWSIPNWIMSVPYSAVQAIVWSCIVYYTVGFAPDSGRFFRFMFLLFSMHQMALGLFRLIAAITRDMVIAETISSGVTQIMFLMGGFVLPKAMIQPWWIWAFWVSPFTYAQRAISVNEFSSSIWMERPIPGGETLGHSILHSRSLPARNYWYWLGVGVLIAYAILFNNLVTLALAYLNPVKKTQPLVLLDMEEQKDDGIVVGDKMSESVKTEVSKKGMILPFESLSMTFHNVNYFVDMPKEMKDTSGKRLQILSNISGVFSPGVLTALVGASGTGKTTLMDVLAGRKTGGYIEGDVRISGRPIEQKTLARILGYVEGNDIHSPQLTVEESLLFSSWLRLPMDINKESKSEFVEEVLRLMELDALRNALVGLPGTSGLSRAQRKRLTIAVELVANPSVIFMDEPTSGLDARAAAIVMHTIRNMVDTGRTVVCTIHQPSIDIFEAFDELLLMKQGGQVIYGGKLGLRSQTMIDYFQTIDGITPIADGYNPATWVLEVTTKAVEEKIGQDFSDIYKNSNRFREIEAQISQLSVPPDGSGPLKFSFASYQDSLTQLRICLWKQNLVYWRSPRYNSVRLLFSMLSAVIIGTVFWNIGSKRDSPQDLLAVMGALLSACLFLGANNAVSVQPVIAIERTVYYREKAAGMYSSFSYAAAQGLIEIPYIALQSILYCVITYFMMNFERTTEKFLLYLLFMFLTFSYFTCYGIMAVGLTANLHFAAVVSSAFYSIWVLFSALFIPIPKIPRWWIWFYYICPVGWSLRGVITSQFGDFQDHIVGLGFDGTVKEYIEDRLGSGPGMIGISIVLIGFSVLFFSVYYVSIRILNFQKR